MTEEPTPQILRPDGKPVKAEPSNLLILTDKENDGIAKPYQHWQEEVDRLTPKGTLKVDKEKGFEDNLQYDDPSLKNMTPVERPKEMPRSLPPEFCPLCGKYDVGLSIRKSPLLYHFMHNFAGVDIKIGSAVQCYVMDKCMRKLIDGDDEEVEDRVIDTSMAASFRTDCKRAKAYIIEERIVDYMRIKYLTGHDKDSAIFGDDTRKERFAHKEDLAT